MSLNSSHLQHDKVRHSKLQHMQESPDSLLQDTRSELGDLPWRNPSSSTGYFPWQDGFGGFRDSSLGVLLDVLGDDVAVKFLGGAAEELEGHDEENDADAGACEHAVGFDLP